MHKARSTSALSRVDADAIIAEEETIKGETFEEHVIPGFRHCPMTGVIYVTNRAVARGYSTSNEQWVNFGQGMPEVGALGEGTPDTDLVECNVDSNEYAPVAGDGALRQTVADFYNELYRKGKESKYTAENVAICAGGRMALTRLAAVLGDVNVGHFIPDYTAYEELLTIFKAFTPIPLVLQENEDWTMSGDDVRQHIVRLGLGALLVSNPCNPTGQHLRGKALSDWVRALKETECSGIFDEFYSHYVYATEGEELGDGNLVSAAQFVDDVNRDPVVILDGLTKNWRRPGWRVSWTIGPRAVIRAVTSAGSFLDGGAACPIQRTAADLLNVPRALDNARLLQAHFRRKRDLVLERLQSLGIRVSCPPQGAFYIWADVSSLPPPLNTGMGFFEAGLDYSFITTPGEFFDVNPGRRRKRSAFTRFVRISFGPKLSALETGLDSIARMIQDAREQASLLPGVDQ